LQGQLSIGKLALQVDSLLRNPDFPFVRKKSKVFNDQGLIL
jgi:hypothetical protein